MNYNDQQELEVQTIKKRTIALDLSNEDCENVAKIAGIYGFTVGELLENFIGDLIDKIYRNDSDGFWFGMFPKESLLKHLLDYGYDVGDFITFYDELKRYEANPQDFTEDIEEAKENGEEMLWFEQEYHDYVDEFFNNNKDTDMEKEVKLCKKWLAELNMIKGENI